MRNLNSFSFASDGFALTIKFYHGEPQDKRRVPTGNEAKFEKTYMDMVNVNESRRGLVKGCGVKGNAKRKQELLEEGKSCLMYCLLFFLYCCCLSRL